MAKSKYTAKEIQVLEGLDPVRKRPGMYIGSTDSRGLHELVREIVDNSVDESFAGVAKNIWVQIDKDGKVYVADDGRGIPVDRHKSGVSALEVTMTKLHGVGASVVNALSSYFLVVVLRDGKAYYQEYKKGNPLKKVAEITQSQLDKLLPKNWQTKIKRGESGTTTIFTPDKDVFSTTDFDAKIIKGLLRDRAYLIPGLSFHFEDEREGDEAHYYFEGGIKSLVAHTNREKNPISGVVYMQKEEGQIPCEVALH